MPLYEYACETCGEQVELLIRSGDKPACPHCQGTRLIKLLSVVAGHVANTKRAPDPGGCGRPQCGSGGCAGMG